MKKSSKQHLSFGFIIVSFICLQMSCLSSGTPTIIPESSTQIPTSSSGIEPSEPTLEEQPTQDTLPAPEETSEPQPTEETPLSPVESVALYYNLPQAILTESTGLFASPNRSEYVINVTIPVGETIYVMGRNTTASHLRVVWNTGVGWIPVSFTNYNGDKGSIEVLPIFKRDPPACVIPLTTQFSLNSEWKSTTQQRIAVVIDLFRSRYGDFPKSSLALTVNGVVIEDSRRQIVEQGQFTLKDVVFTLPDYVLPGDTIGYLLETSSNEDLAFTATIFSIPENCVWDTD